jgi:hypothetical protein
MMTGFVTTAANVLRTPLIPVELINSNAVIITDVLMLVEKSA